MLEEMAEIGMESARRGDSPGGSGGGPCSGFPGVTRLTLNLQAKIETELRDRSPAG